MNICIPTTSNNGKTANVNEHFGSAPYFAIYDTDNASLKFIENTNAHHSHGTCHPMKSLSRENIEVVICSGMGVRAVQKLDQQGIKAYKASAGTVEEMISKFENQTLNNITIDSACREHGCH